MRFVADPVADELVTDPVLLLRDIAQAGYGAGDCDDVATLGATLAESVGLPARFIVVGFDAPDAPFSHVYAEIADGFGGWRELDTTRRMPDVERRRRTLRVNAWPIHGSGEGDGMGCADCSNDLRNGFGLGAEEGQSTVIVGEGDTLPPGEWECVEIESRPLSPWIILGGIAAVVTLLSEK